MNSIPKQNFNEIYDKTYHQTLRYVISKCSNLSDVEDIMQNIYLKLYDIIMKNKYEINNYQAFLIKLAKNELFKYHSLKNKFKVIIKRNNEDDDFDLIENLQDDKLNIEEDVFNKIALESIWLQIQKLELLSQKIIALYYLEELKISEIANLLQINESTIKSRLYRSIKQLKTLLESGENNE